MWKSEEILGRPQKKILGNSEGFAEGTAEYFLRISGEIPERIMEDIPEEFRINFWSILKGIPGETPRNFWKNFKEFLVELRRIPVGSIADIRMNYRWSSKGIPHKIFEIIAGGSLRGTPMKFLYKLRRNS